MAFSNRKRALSHDSLSGTERMGSLGKQGVKNIGTNEAREDGLVCMPCLAQVGIPCGQWVFTVAGSRDRKKPTLTRGQRLQKDTLAPSICTYQPVV